MGYEVDSDADLDEGSRVQVWVLRIAMRMPGRCRVVTNPSYHAHAPRDSGCWLECVGKGGCMWFVMHWGMAALVGRACALHFWFGGSTLGT